MKHIKLILALGLSVLSFVSHLQADELGRSFIRQHGPFFHLLFWQKAELEASYALSPDRKEDGGPGEYDMQEFAANLDAPVALDGNRFFRVGLQYGQRSYDFADVPAAATNFESRTFNKIGLGFGMGSFISSDTLLMGNFRPGLYSDLENGFDVDHFQYYGDGMIVHRMNPGALILAGIRMDETFDEVPILPFVGLRLLSNDGKLHISLTLPIELQVGYSVNQSVHFYTRAALAGEEYTASINGGDDEMRVSVQDRRVGVGSFLWLADFVHIKIEGGAEMGSQLNFKLRNAGQFSGDIKPGAYLQAGLGFAF
ncbi:MAG: DUF6268 family outer membrane beta-barrel protein [bacterium]|nr:DUF6268 family outer membrane beta-barrel protein [bacterium]